MGPFGRDAPLPCLGVHHRVAHPCGIRILALALAPPQSWRGSAEAREPVYVFRMSRVALCTGADARRDAQGIASAMHKRRNAADAPSRGNPKGPKAQHFGRDHEGRADRLLNAVPLFVAVFDHA
jgi:hypothetical protein